MKSAIVALGVMVVAAAALGRPQKSVIRSPFMAWPKPVWFGSHRSAHRLVPHLVRFEACHGCSGRGESSLLLNILKFGYPLPNNNNRANNFVSGGPTKSQNNAYLVRVDHNFSASRRMFVRYSHRTNKASPAQFFPDDII